MSDLPANITTPVTLNPGERHVSDLGFFGDTDWIALRAPHGVTLEVTLDGHGTNPLGDPYLRIYDSLGFVVAENDDRGVSDYNATVRVVNDGRGPYYAEVDSFDGIDTGTYRIAAREVRAFSPIDSIAWNTVQVLDNTVSVHFVPRGESRTDPNDFATYTSEGFNAYERAQFMRAFAMIEAVANVTFAVTKDRDADFQLVLDTNEVFGEFLGYFNPPGEPGAGLGVFDGASWDRQSDGNLDVGGLGFVTVVHEVLHGLGLAHPHDDGGGSPVMAGVIDAFDSYGTAGLNQGVFTTMTYNDGYPLLHPVRSENEGMQAGPMALDIAVLQMLYGANMETARGDDVYLLRGSNDGNYWQAIWDAGGTDELRFDGSRNADLDLRAATLRYEDGGGGYVSSVHGIAGGFTIANGVTIERATGGFGDDVIDGNGAANVLTGRGGDDLIRGRGGDDLIRGGHGADDLFGGSGDDRIFGKRSSDVLVGNGGDDVLNGNGGADRLTGQVGNDALKGGRGGDRLDGGRGADSLKGGRGDDRLVGGRGEDMLTGGTGRDVFDFNKVADSFDGAGRDTITDFQRGADRINLRDIDADTTQSGDQAFAFIGRDGFDEAGDLRYRTDDDDLILQGDVDGDGRADFEIRLEDTWRLAVDDFVL